MAEPASDERARLVANWIQVRSNERRIRAVGNHLADFKPRLARVELIDMLWFRSVLIGSYIMIEAPNS